MSGTTAGFEFAKKNNLGQQDVDNYSGPSESFRNGMQKFVTEQMTGETFKQDTGEPINNNMQ